MALVEKERAFYNDDSAKKDLSSTPPTLLAKATPAEEETIEIGDLVQWESDGVLRMEAPRLVRAIQDEWAFVEGSETGIPMDELILERKGSGESGKATPPKLALPADPVVEMASPHEKELLRGTISKAQGITYRLMVTGELGSREIGKLIKLLEAQKLVLEEDDETGLTFPPPRSSFPSNL